MKIWSYFLCFVLLLACGGGIAMKQCYKKDNPQDEKFILDEDSWELMLHGEWMIGFCVPMIMACVKFDRVWTKFAREMKLQQSNITVASMKLEYSETVIKRFSLIDLPTILHVKDGVVRQLPIVHSVEGFKELALIKWQETDPIPCWLHPNGLLIRAHICYIRAINAVYHTTWLDMDYEHSTWLVRVGLMLILAMTLTAFSAIYTYKRNKSSKHIKKIKNTVKDDEVVVGKGESPCETDTV